MALREKTQIGSGEREQSRLMMQAGETGVGQRLQAGQELAGQTQRTGEIALQGGQALGARLGEYERQKLEETRLTQARDIAKGQEMAEGRRAELDEAVQGYERVPGGPKSPLMAEDRERQVREGMDRGTAGADPGGQQQPGAAPGGAAPPGETPQGAGAAPALAEPSVSPRPEGQAARLQQQGMQPIELGPGGQPARPGEPQEPGALRMSPTGERREDRADYEAQTRRMEAMNRMAVQQNTAMRAEFAGDETAYKELESQMDNGINHLSDVFTRMKNGTMQRNDFKEVTKWAQDMGMQDNEADNGMLMGILKDASSTGFTPREGEEAARLQDFMQGYMNRRAYEYTLVLGHTPPDFIDEASPMKQAFGAASMEFTAIMQGLGPVAQQAWGIQSYREKIRMQNRWAAAQVLTGKTAAPGGGAFGLPDVTPPATQPQQIGAAGEEPIDVTREVEAREAEQAARVDEPSPRRNWGWAKDLPK